MKKNILCISILVVILICVCLILKYNSKKTNNKNIENIPSNVSEVLSIEMKEETEGGYIYYKTEERELIEKIVNALNKIEIKGKTNIAFSDNTKTYTLKISDGTMLTYCFQNNYYNKDNVNYEIYNYQELMKIKIPEVNK